MTQLITKTPETFETALTAMAGRCNDAPDWLADHRAAAIARFTELGLPTLKHEEWRFTDLAPVASTDWQLATGDAPGTPGTPGAPVTSADLEPFSFGGIAAVRLVFVDGRFRRDLSVTRSLPAGVTVTGLAEAIAAHGAEVRNRLGQLAPMEEDGLTALNAALLEDGAYVHVAAGVTLDAPIRLLYVNTTPSAPTICCPRNLIVVDANAQATIVESYASLGEGASLTNVVGEVFVGDGARVQLYTVQRENERAMQVSTLRVRIGRDATFESHKGLFGGSLVRNNVEAELAGTGGHALLNGVFVPMHDQHVDNHMRVVHAAANCTSRQLYKGILGDDATGAFAGRIVVNPGAQKTDALQTNRNLLLSDRAKVNTKPQLEIFADDVKCTHGATTGQIDTDALYYMRARGIDADTARGLLVYAFAHEVLDLMPYAPLRTTLERFLLDRLPHGDMLRAIFA